MNYTAWKSVTSLHNTAVTTLSHISKKVQACLIILRLRKWYRHLRNRILQRAPWLRIEEEGMQVNTVPHFSGIVEPPGRWPVKTAAACALFSIQVPRYRGPVHAFLSGAVCQAHRPHTYHSFLPISDDGWIKICRCLGVGDHAVSLQPYLIC